MGVFVVNVTAGLCSIFLNIFHPILAVTVEAKLRIEKEQLELQKLKVPSA